MPLNDLAGVARMAARLPDELQKGQRRGVAKAALTVTRGIRGEIKTATGGDNRLSGVGRKGARVGAKYDIHGTANPTATIRATGPLHLIEHPTSAHIITPKYQKALKLRSGDFAASAMHPGTRAKRPFEKGYLKTRDETGAIFDAEIQKSIIRVLG